MTQPLQPVALPARTPTMQGNRIIVSVTLSEGEESRETVNNVIPVKTGVSTPSWRSA